MMMLSKKVEYGLIALLHMDAQDSTDWVISSKEIAEAHDLPAELLGKVMQAMARAGMLEAEHGSRGGYRLAKPLETLSLGQVVGAIEGPLRLVKCRHDADDCSKSANCIVKKPLLAIHERLDNFIDEITLDQLRTGNSRAASMG